MVSFIGVITESGPAAFVPGVPTRDLDLSEWNELTPEQRRLAFASGLYTGAPEPPPEVVVVPAPTLQDSPAELEPTSPADAESTHETAEQEIE